MSQTKPCRQQIAPLSLILRCASLVSVIGKYLGSGFLDVKGVYGNTGIGDILTGDTEVSDETELGEGLGDGETLGFNDSDKLGESEGLRLAYLLGDVLGEILIDTFLDGDTDCDIACDNDIIYPDGAEVVA